MTNLVRASSPLKITVMAIHSMANWAERPSRRRKASKPTSSAYKSPTIRSSVGILIWTSHKVNRHNSVEY